MRLPRKPPDSDELLKEMLANTERFQHALSLQTGPLQGNKYRHWDECVYLTPPGDLNHREWWFGIKLSRNPLLKRLPLTDTKGDPFLVAMPDPVLEMTHAIDRDASGQIEISEQVTNPLTR